MHVLDPNNSSHDLYIMPRYYDTGTALRVDLYDENRGTSETLTPTVLLENQYIKTTITKTVAEGEEFSLKLYDSANDLIYYRGKAFATEQTPQEYKLYE